VSAYGKMKIRMGKVGQYYRTPKIYVPTNLKIGVHFSPSKNSLQKSQSNPGLFLIDML